MSRRTCGPAFLVLASLAACVDVTDPETGFVFETTVLAPDTILVGATSLLMLEVFDDEGRVVSGLGAEWNVVPAPGLPVVRILGDDGVAASLRADRIGVGRVAALLTGGPVDIGAADTAVVVSVANGMRIADEGEPGIDVDIYTTSTLRLEVFDDRGEPLSDVGAAARWHVLGSSGSADSVVQTQQLGAFTMVADMPLCVGRCSDTVEVRVVQVAAELTIPELDFLLYIGAQDSLDATVIDRNGYLVDDPHIVWSLVNPADTAIVALDGSVVTARGNGSVLLKATHASLADSAYLLVRQVADSVATSMTLPARLPLGARDTFTVAFFDAGGHPLEYEPYPVFARSWNEDVAVVQPLGSGWEIVTTGVGTTLIDVAVENAFLPAFNIEVVE